MSRRKAPPKKAAETMKDSSLYTPIGTTGLEHYSGYVREEFLSELQGTRWFEVVRRMSDNNPIVGAVMYVIQMLIKQVEWDVVPADNTPEAAEIAEFVKSCLDDMDTSFHETLGEILSFLEYGWSWMEVTYKRRLGEKSDSFISSDYDDGRIGWAEWGIRGQESLLNWEFDDRGDVMAMVQLAPPNYKTVTIPLAKSLHFKNGGRKQNPEGRSVLRTAYRPWYFMKNIEEIEGIGIERDLAGLPVAFIPSNATADVKTEWENIVANIRNDSQAGVVSYSDRDEHGNLFYDLKLLSTGGARQFDTNAIINRYERQIAQTVVANFIVTGMQSHGSFSLHSSQTALFSTALGGHLKTVTTTTNRYAIPRLVKLNGWKKELSPTLVHGDIETIDLEQLGKYVSVLSGTGVVFDQKQLNYLLDQAGIPAPQDGIE